MNGYIVLASALVGLLVGMTGAGGGALMTPMLVLLFGISPAAAISSDLVAAVVMRPVGGAVHLRRGTVNLRLVGWLALGSVPAAFAGAYVLHLLGHAHNSEKLIQIILGAALLAGVAAMVVRWVVGRRQRDVPATSVADVAPRPLLTVLVGLVGGFMVGLTSVGAGSLMIVLLLFVYPRLRAKELVGTDLVQAIPLTAAAALGQLAFGHVVFGVTAAVIVGSVPAVLVGSLLSSRAPDRLLRPVVGLVVFASGLKYVGASPGGVALGAGLALLAVLGVSLVGRQRRPAPAPAPLNPSPAPAPLNP